jgi:hypothetical protein
MVPGTVLTSQWLLEQGVSNDLARRYVSSGWLERLAQGAYARSGDHVDWQGALYSLQTQLHLNVHVAGLSALRLKGFGHDASLQFDPSILLLSDRTRLLPAWFQKVDWEVAVEHHSISLFGSAENLSMSSVQHKSFEIIVSSPERAAFELLYCIKTNADFDYARTVFEGLGTLRPNEIQQLLFHCRSVRVKRLFLWMAKSCGHPWMKYVNTDHVHLGCGKRAIYEGGRLDQEFKITVPRTEGFADV